MARTPLKNLADEHFRKLQEAEDKARKLAEEQRLAKLREARPNPKEVEKVEPVEVEPIKQIVKYSPLMIAGVIAVVVILLLKRRRV
jgi:rRNA maturation endonuclease Nob1